jgi:hypothetical protein
MPPKILLTDTSRWAASSRVAIGLSRRGCKVSSVCPSHHPLLKTRVVERTFLYSSFSPLDSLVDAIKATDPQLIIPCDDLATQHLHELYERARIVGSSGAGTAALIERSLGSPKSHPIVESRYETIRIAREEGVRAPCTSVINTVDDLRRWGAGQALPWVLKATGTWGGRGVRIVNSIDQAVQAFSELTGLFSARRVVKRAIVNGDSFGLRPWWNRSRPDVIVQSYIHGRPANCAVVCWQGKVLAGIGVEVVSAVGPTEPAMIVRVVDSPEMMRAAEAIAGRLSLTGFIGLDFMIEDSSGSAYFIEMNPRCTPLCHFQLGKGRDLIGALTSQLCGEKLQEMPAVTQNELIAYFPQAWDSQSKFLEVCFQDLPVGEPELIEELRRPWPNRNLLFRVFSYVEQIRSRALPKDRVSPEKGSIHGGSDLDRAPSCAGYDQVGSSPVSPHHRSDGR